MFGRQKRREQDIKRCVFMWSMEFKPIEDDNKWEAVKNVLDHLLGETNLRPAIFDINCKLLDGILTPDQKNKFAVFVKENTTLLK